MRKILSIMLCALLLIGMFPLAVVAEELNTDAAVTVAASADGQNDVDDTVEEGITDAAEQEINEENDIALLAVEAGEENGYKYNLLIDSVTDEKYACIVSYTGTSADLTIPDSLGGYPVRMIGYEAFANNKVITGVVIPDSVTEIDTYAFSNCINLSSVKLSQNLKKIGGNVFYNCQALKAIEIPKSLTQTDIYYGGAFNSSGLETVTFEEGVTKIPAKLFNQCTSLKEITIPDTVTEIGEWAFSYCTNLSQVTLSKNLTFIDYYAFDHCTSLKEIEIPKSLVTTGQYERGPFIDSGIEKISFEEGTEKIADRLFDDCSNLKEVVIPDTVTEIGNAAFMDCTNLASVKLPSNLQSLGGSAFENCVSLQEIEIPKSLNKVNESNYNGPFYESGLKTVIFADGTTEIAEYLFDGCTELADVTIPDTVTEIGRSAFGGCTALKEIEIPKSVTSGTAAFDSSGLERALLADDMTTVPPSLFYGCKNLQEVDIPYTVKKIEYGAFRYCESLKNIELPDAVTEIGNAAFNGCSSLQKIDLPKNITGINYETFKDCTSLTSIELPDTVTSISDSAFSGCTALAEIIWPNGEKNLSLSRGAFQGCTALKEIEIPAFVTWNTWGEYASVFVDSGLEKVTFAGNDKELKKGLINDCPNLTEIVFPDTMTSLGEGALQNCTALTSINLEQITNIGTSAFEGCSNLTNVTFNDELIGIGDRAFYGCSSLKNINLPSKLQWLGQWAFNGCAGIERLEMPDTLNDMDQYAFADCTSLQTLKLSKGLTRIAPYAFYNDKLLNQVEIPSGVESIERRAFANCKNLTEVSIPESVTYIDPTAFDNYDRLKIYGTSGSYAEEFAKANKADFIATDSSDIQISLDKTELTLIKGVQDIIKMEATPLGVSDKAVWNSSNTNVATVSQSGIVKAVDFGTATITVTIGTAKAECVVTVVQPVTSIELEQTALELNPAETVQLKAVVAPDNANQKINWSSSDPEIASVDENGMVTAHKAGTAIMTATACDGSGVKASCQVTVLQAVTAIEMKKKAVTLNVAESTQLKAEVLPSDAVNKTLKWTSGDSNIASVDESGIVTAHKVGTAIITATACDGSGVSAACTVTVVQATQAIELDQTVLELNIAKTAQLTATILPDDATNKSVKWSTSDQEIATVDENGLVTAHKKGAVVITATASDNIWVTADCAVTVYELHNASRMTDLETSHPYDNTTSDTWVYTRNKATYLELTFDQQTMIAENDYLYVYDSEDNEIGKYTGAELAGQTVHIDGNTIKIKLVSNSDDGAWGFKVTDIKSDGIIYGDLNDDGEINSTDITMARRYYKGNLELTPGQLECLDLNLDGEINSTDITILRRYYKGAISEIPIGR